MYQLQQTDTDTHLLNLIGVNNENLESMPNFNLLKVIHIVH